MSFIYPAFLFATAAIAIPIIIHLFYFRRFKTVYFTNVRFLREVKEETQSRQKLRNLLVLLMRCLAIIFLVFAFAQPFIPSKKNAGNNGKQDVSIYIDNSFSMQGLSEDVPLFEKAKQRAQEILAAYEPDDRFQILTTDFEGRDQRLLSKDDALARINELKISYSVKEISRVLARQKQALLSGDGKNKTAYLLTDFQRNCMDMSVFKDDTINIQPVVLQSVGIKNVAIDSAWFDAPVQMPNQTNALVVKLRNYGETEAENVRVTVSLDGQVKPSGNLNIPALAVAYDTVNLTVLNTGWHQAEVAITDYPVEFDDHYFFAFKVEAQINVLQVYAKEPNRNIRAAYASNPYFKCDPISSGQIDFSKFKDYQLIILDGIPSISSGLSSELATYIKNGGNVLLFPAAGADLASYNVLCNAVKADTYAPFDQTTRQVASVNHDEFIFKDVYINKRDNLKLPETKGNFKLARTANSSEEELLRYRDGNLFVGKTRFEKGNFYQCASPLDANFSNLTQNGEIFVPMLIKMSLAKGQDEPIAYIIGKDNVIATENRNAEGETVYKLKGNNGEFIPEMKSVGENVFLTLNNQIKEAGYYDLKLKDDAILDKFAFNNDRRESDLHYLVTDEVQKIFGDNVISGTDAHDFKQVVGERSHGTALWKWCVLATLLFLLIEVLLLRFWKV